ncbi:MAG: hypothetical protein Q9174_006210 [Haloplaca sp. 1 TL-2023]
MTSSSTSTATPPKHPFERRLEDVKLSKADLNSVIMDYLITEGYSTAAEKFATEANVPRPSNIETVQQRVEIRDAIHKGDIQTAVEKINELHPALLEKDPSLHFALLRLQLVELIRKTHPDSDENVLEAIEFATDHLAPRAPADPQFMEDLELTMTLLVFKSKELPPELSAMLDPKLREEVGTRVNEALLKEQGERTKSKLLDLVRLRAWAAQKAREAKKDLPENLGLGLEDVPAGPGNGAVQSNGSGEAMVA